MADQTRTQIVNPYRAYFTDLALEILLPDKEPGHAAFAIVSDPDLMIFCSVVIMTS